MAKVFAQRTGEAFVFEVSPDCDPAHARKMRQGAVAALLRHLAGGITLHASAVVFGDDGVLFLGESGSGKSTVAADLCEREGRPLLGDDAVALTLTGDVVTARPTENSSWLTSESMAMFRTTDPFVNKTCLPSRNAANRDVPLRAMIKLGFQDDSEECSASRMGGREAFELLSRSLFRFVLDEPDVTVRDFENLARVAAGVPMFELLRPRALHKLADSRAAVRRLLQHLACGEP